MLLEKIARVCLHVSAQKVSETLKMFRIMGGISDLIETFNRPRLHTVGQQVSQYSTTAKPHQQEFPVILEPCLLCWAPAEKGRLICELMTRRNT